jgi:hypothetical protein
MDLGPIPLALGLIKDLIDNGKLSDRTVRSGRD